MDKPQIAITSAHQFPTLDAATNPANREIGLSAGLGAVLFKSPYGVAFYKGGHDDWTDNLAVCVESKKSCILLMSNSVRGEITYPALIKSLFGDTGLPWSWEYNPQGSPPPITASAIPQTSQSRAVHKAPASQDVSDVVGTGERRPLLIFIIIVPPLCRLPDGFRAARTAL